MSRKIEFALAARRAVSSLDNLVSSLNELDSIYKNSGYDSGGPNPITPADLGDCGVTPEDLASVSTFVENVNLFLNGGDPLEYDYAAKIDAFRTMPTQL